MSDLSPRGPLNLANEHLEGALLSGNRMLIAEAREEVQRAQLVYGKHLRDSMTPEQRRDHDEAVAAWGSQIRVR